MKSSLSSFVKHDSGTAVFVFRLRSTWTSSTFRPAVGAAAGIARRRYSAHSRNRLRTRRTSGKCCWTWNGISPTWRGRIPTAESRRAAVASAGKTRPKAEVAVAAIAERKRKGCSGIARSRPRTVPSTEKGQARLGQVRRRRRQSRQQEVMVTKEICGSHAKFSYETSTPTVSGQNRIHHVDEGQTELSRLELHWFLDPDICWLKIHERTTQNLLNIFWNRELPEDRRYRSPICVLNMARKDYHISPCQNPFH